MPKLKRSVFSGYYKTPTSGKSNLLMGCEIYHATHCGVFELDGIEYNLMHFWFVKDDLPDTLGKNQESFDMSADDADVIVEEFASSESGIGSFLPCVAEHLAYDVAEGLTDWEIMEKRVGVLVWHFMGFTFDQVVGVFPQILTETTDDEGNVSVNLRRYDKERP